jgi:hypothetical protein
MKVVSEKKKKIQYAADIYLLQVSERDPLVLN